MPTKENLIVPNAIETKPSEDTPITTYHFNDGTVLIGLGYYDTVGVITEIDHPIKGKNLPPTPTKQWRGAMSATEALLRKTRKASSLKHKNY